MMFEVKNIKLSLKIAPLDLNSVVCYLSSPAAGHPTTTTTTVQTKNNFVIIRDRYVYVIFRSNSGKFGHVNITKVPSYSLVQDAIDHILSLLKPFNVVITLSKIDNISASLNLQRTVNIHRLSDILNAGCTYTVSINKEKFPGAFIKCLNGTIIIFHSGKVVAIGCKDINTLEKLYFEVISNISTHV
jgi:TATA-box binding protein (TBP) (component of TFIID and TFIIIB)